MGARAPLGTASDRARRPLREWQGRWRLAVMAAVHSPRREMPAFERNCGAIVAEGERCGHGKAAKCRQRLCVWRGRCGVPFGKVGHNRPMSDILTYLETQLATFDEEPFNAVDSALLAQFCMARGEGIMPRVLGCGEEAAAAAGVGRNGA